MKGPRSKKLHELHAFVNIFVEASLLDDVVEALSKIDAVEELYEVTGEFDIVTLVWAPNIEELSDILKNRIMKIKGVKSTITSIALSPHKGPKCTKAATETTVPDNKNPM